LAKDRLGFRRTDRRPRRPGVTRLLVAVFLEIERFEALGQFGEQSRPMKGDFVVDPPVLVDGADRFRGVLPAEPVDGTFIRAA
jgi:hypothetical protein